MRKRDDRDFDGRESERDISIFIHTKEEGGRRRSENQLAGSGGTGSGSGEGCDGRHSKVWEWFESVGSVSDVDLCVACEMGTWWTNASSFIL